MSQHLVAAKYEDSRPIDLKECINIRHLNMPVGHLPMFSTLQLLDATFTHVCTDCNCMRTCFMQVAVLLKRSFRSGSITCQQYTQKQNCPTLSCSKCSSSLALMHVTVLAVLRKAA